MFDRALQFGDGLFETLAVVDGRPCLWQRHMRRLQAGGERLNIQIPSAKTLWQEALSLIGSRARGVLKLILTRGDSERGYAAPANIVCKRIMYLSDWPSGLQDKWDAGVRLGFCSTRLGMNPSLAGIKHLNRLEQVLARNEWQDESITEGIMLDMQDRVVEGTMSNLFIEHDGRLLTPDLSQAGVAGVVRELVMDTAERLGQAVTETNISKEQLLQADACYITNSLLGIRPVTQLEQHTFNASFMHNKVMKSAAEQVFE